MHRLLAFGAAFAALLLPAGCGGAEAARPAGGASDAADRARAAERMVRAGRGTLAPVYAPLAEYLVDHLDLADKDGVGIDVGSGPGTLVVELARRTRMHWVNADINPHFFPHFYRRAEEAGVGHRVSAVRADARHLPFRSGWADVVVSRGSFHFWGDRDERKKGFAEIYRVLAPGGVAYIGRGFSPNLPVETARRIRAKQGKKMQYDRRKLADQLVGILKDLGIAGYRMHLPDPPGTETFHYGVWVEFRKPAAGGE
ncbi:MAG: class I SAM-dependent methyltransferase [Phycisphaerae bacterium]